VRRFIRTYEEFRFKEDQEDVLVKDIEKSKKIDTKNTTDNPVDTKFMDEDSEDTKSFIDASGKLHIKNWNVY
jgi:hypothetical protein